MLLLSSVGLLLFIIAVGYSFSLQSQDQAKLNINARSADQLRLVAMSGVQEALGTRFSPRSNKLNFAPVAGVDPMYADSGRVVQNGKLVGLYNYLIVGGDAARDPATGAMNSNVLNLVNNRPTIDQPFYVLSQGSVCTDAGGSLLTNQLQVSANGAITCGTGRLSQTTTVAQTLLDGNGTAGADRMMSVRQAPNPNNIQLPTPVTLPNGNVSSTINFSALWDSNDSGAVPNSLVTYPLGDSALVSPLVPITGPVVTLPHKVGADHAIRLFFNSDMDYRSLYNDDPAACTSNPRSCSIRIEARDASWNPVIENGLRKTYGAASLIPVFPGGTQLLVFPPSDSSNALDNNSNYAIVIDGSFRDSRGNTLGNTREIRFTVEAPKINEPLPCTSNCNPSPPNPPWPPQPPPQPCTSNCNPPPPPPCTSNCNPPPPPPPPPLPV